MVADHFEPFLRKGYLDSRAGTLADACSDTVPPAQVSRPREAQQTWGHTGSEGGTGP